MVRAHKALPWCGMTTQSSTPTTGEVLRELELRLTLRPARARRGKPPQLSEAWNCGVVRAQQQLALWDRWAQRKRPEVVGRFRSHDIIVLRDEVDRSPFFQSSQHLKKRSSYSYKSPTKLRRCSATGKAPDVVACSEIGSSIVSRCRRREELAKLW